jgi:diguanylate cyclase (GGDEF)-like protein
LCADGALTQVKARALTLVNAGCRRARDDCGMKRPYVRALQGVALSVASPLGWLLLRWLDDANLWLELVWRPGIYVYLLFGTAAAFAGFGWYVGRQEERHRENSLHDVLTRLYNVRYFWSRLEDEHGFAVRHRRPLALLIGDIDWFKKVNDKWGHAAGDRVLAAVAGALMRLRRRGDTIARIGGEEFGVILPDTDLREATEVAERLREAVAALRFDSGFRSAAPYSVTMSFGAVALPLDEPQTMQTLYERADAAMYAAKRAGRNRVATGGAAGRQPGLPSAHAA